MATDRKSPYRLKRAETVTILAALRHWQRSVDESARASWPHFENRAPLTDEQIDDLCERLNTADAPG